MFGYIKVYKPELRIKEWEMYKAVYCSLCRQLGREYGVLSKFTLSYDFTFLALFAMSLENRECSVEKKHCAFNPLKKCNYCTNSDDTFKFCAATSAIAVYYKAVDNLKDEKGFEKLKYVLLYPWAKSAYKKARKKYPEVDGIFKEYMKSQQNVEENDVKNIDAAAEPTAKMLSRLFAMCAARDSDKRAAERLGYCIGRFIYTVDAASDYEKDVKKGRYNPYTLTQNVTENAERQLAEDIDQAILAFELINIYRFKNILGNVLYLGLDDVMKKELKI